MNMDNIVFVILNYNLFEEVVDCVNSIKNKIDTKKYHIIIVDNCSPNNSGMKLLNYYASEEKVLVKVLDKNLGFAKGNNCGIALARDKFLPKYVCCLNNDTLLIDDSFFRKVEECYKETNAAVIAPKVYLKDNSIQELIGELQSKDFYKKLLYSMSGKGFYGNIHKIKQYLNQIDLIVNIHKSIKQKMQNKLNPLEENKNIILHGCCLIFTPVFFRKLIGFNPKTFMFREEELLFLSLKNNNLTNIYYPKLEIKHLEDVSTNATFKTNKTKAKFLKDNQIESLKILINEMEVCENLNKVNVKNSI